VNRLSRAIIHSFGMRSRRARTPVPDALGCTPAPDSLFAKVKANTSRIPTDEVKELDRPPFYVEVLLIQAAVIRIVSAREFGPEFILSMLAVIGVFCQSRSDTALEVLALRQQGNDW
jgi:hypothetical protein